MFTIKGIFQKGLHLFGIVSFLTLGIHPAVAGDPASYKKVSASDEAHPSDASWQQKLKQQIEAEDTMEGRAGHSEKVDAAMKKLMDEIEAASPQSSHSNHSGHAGPFQDLGTMQQMDRGFLLGPVANMESVATGGKCPANAPVRTLDISAINVEITLNQWLDYHPGYMYVLTENIPAVRAEEKRNQEARKMPGYNPGAVSTGLQGDMIQPLSIRAIRKAPTCSTAMSEENLPVLD
ncbi:MAG: hypothetical protein HY202_09860 [Nitrospirae bacterium]|nr:hypothetical protein [Nitrospirota bacterium]